MEFKFSRKVRTKQNDKKEFQWGFKLPQRFLPPPHPPERSFSFGVEGDKKKK